MAEHSPTLIFDGPIEAALVWAKTARAVNKCYRGFCGATDEPDPGEAGFVYILGDAAVGTRPVYIGKTVNPQQRFHSHRRRDWWGRIEYAVILMVDCRGHETCSPATRDKVLLDWESVFINALEPDANLLWPGAPKDMTNLGRICS